MQNDNPLVSVIIPVYNGANYLAEAIESALSQTYSNCEIIVINDGSCDNNETEKVAKSYGDMIVYYDKLNGGVASALNYGIQQMKGEYFSWLSHDDYYYPDKIKKEINAIIESGDRTTLVQAEYEFYHMNSKTFTKTDFHKYYSMDQLTNSVFSILQLQLHACSALIHKSYFDKVGVFDESLKTVQDIDMWFRIFRKQKSLFIPEVLHFVREHNEAGSNTISCYHEETGKTYLKLVNLMSYEEMIDVFGDANSFLCRIAGFLKSYGRVEEYNAIVKKIKNCPQKSILDEQDSIAELKRYINSLSDNNATSIAIFGAGQYGIRVKYELGSRLINTDYFIDNNIQKQGTTVDGVLCLSVEEILKKNNNTLIVVAQRILGPALQQLKLYDFKYVVTKQELDARILATLPAMSEKEEWI